MATMVKEKRRPKNKSKMEKPVPESLQAEELLLESPTTKSTDTIIENVSSLNFNESNNENSPQNESYKQIETKTTESKIKEEVEIKYDSEKDSSSRFKTQEGNKEDNSLNQSAGTSAQSLTDIATKETLTDNVNQLDNTKTIEQTSTLSNVQDVQKSPYQNVMQDVQESLEQNIVQDVQESPEQNIPSAPIFDEPQLLPDTIQAPQIEQTSTKHIAVPLEEAMKLFYESEIANVIATSEKEEAIVEKGPISGPEHPLVDLLSTFKRSLTAVEASRHQLTCSINEEEQFRSRLWLIEKRDDNFTRDCKCGSSVYIRVRYEVAELLKHNLPAARMKLELILRDVQDGYCHHQHAALLSHCQIEELLIEIMEGSQSGIREALSLILQALRVSGCGPPALAVALTRWAAALSAALHIVQDTGHLLFLIHHLFRQSHSVRWASSVFRVSCSDSIEAARAITLLDIVLNKTKFEVATECTEELGETWEEVNKHGSTGAVSEGSLRERDLLALVRSFPLREIAARLLTCTKADVTTISENDLIDPYGGHNILKCCYGVRILFSVLHRAIVTHASYRRLQGELRHIISKVAEGLAQLHLYMMANNAYAPQIQIQVSAELSEMYRYLSPAFTMKDVDMLPASLLTDDVAVSYCRGYIEKLHGNSMSCVTCVRLVTAASCARAHHHHLANMVLHFLVQTGLCKKSTSCKFGCEAASRESVTKLLEAHPYLQTNALHILADLALSNTIDPLLFSCLCLPRWRPIPSEIHAILNIWLRNCPKVMEHLLMQLEYTPHVGLSLQSQLTIGSFLCDVISLAPPPIPEWAWLVLRKLRLHRTFWNLSLDVPPPEKEDGLFCMAYALMASSWGHCIPLICTSGVSSLLKLASSRPEDAIHCLGPVMLVMQFSPESVSLTKQFGEVFDTLLSTGPTLVQRALGRGGPSGVQLVQELMFEQLTNVRYGEKSSILNAWLHALWRPGPALTLADEALRISRGWTVIDHFIQTKLQDPSSATLISTILRSASAPLLCDSILRSAHAQHYTSGTFNSVMIALNRQSEQGVKIHVDNALQQINSSMKSDDLCIYSSAYVALYAPAQHPAHLILWTMMMFLYLHRAPGGRDSDPPIGTLFFSGYTKSRVLYQLQKRLQELIAYHRTQVEIFTKKCQGHPKPTQPSRNRPVKVKTDKDSGILPTVSINNLTGESDASDSNSEDETETENTNEDASERERNENEEKEMLRYHVAAEKMLSEYARWLEDGKKTRAMPIHADIARFIPNIALDTAWQTSIQIVKKSEHVPSIPMPPTKSHFEILKNAIMSIKGTKRRRRTVTLNSAIDDDDFKDARTLLGFVEKHLAHLQSLAREWSQQTSLITSLDNQLLQLVRSLRVPRTLPPKSQRCRNKCNPVTIVFSVQEWCINESAEIAISENRSNAVSAIKKLCRPRANSALTVTALHALARRIRSTESAKRVLEAAYRSASHVENCAIAKDAICELVDDLAERWITNDGNLCSDMLSRWSNTSNSLQQHFCASLVNPRKLNQSQWITVYLAVVNSKLPSHVIFSLLSKFEISRWAHSADDSQRQEVVDALMRVMQRWGPSPSSEHNVLLELCGVHSTSVVYPPQLCALVRSCARACVHRTLPIAVCAHVGNSCVGVGPGVDMDQLGYLLRELGVIWWEARTQKKEATDYTNYAVPMANILTVLQRVFVAAAVKMSYAPERVGQYSWSALQESWSPWIVPHSIPALVPPASEITTTVIKMYRDLVAQVMIDCPGTEIPLLRETFTWIVHMRLTCEGSQNQVLMTSLMSEMTSLPWGQHQWLGDKSLQSAVQAVNRMDLELISWCITCLKNISAECWIGNTDDVVTRLADLLRLFTAKCCIPEEIIQESSILPWWGLPAPALDDAQQRFFHEHHNVSLPYHTVPQFTVLLFASGLRMPTQIRPDPHTAARIQSYRLLLISNWIRVMCEPSLVSHVAGGQKCLLDVVSDLVPYLDPDAGELQELLSRAIIIMCIEPAASAAVPIWQSWLSSASQPLVTASLTAVCALTTLEHFASVGDAAVRAYMNFADSTWSLPATLWSACHFTAPAPLVCSRALHAALVTSRAHAQTAGAVREMVVALKGSTVDFIQNELIISVFICYICRITYQYINSEDSTEQDCLASTLALMSWAEEKRSILRTIGLQGQSNVPTANHRLLCHLAKCTLTPGNESYIRAYEACCSSVLGSNPGDVINWGRQPHPSKLVRLATRLYPNHIRYFKEELELVSN